MLWTFGEGRALGAVADDMSVGSQENPGVNTRALKELFRLVAEKGQDYSFEMTISILEIYCETIRSLELFVVFSAVYCSCCGNIFPALSPSPFLTRECSLFISFHRDLLNTANDNLQVRLVLGSFGSILDSTRDLSLVKRGAFPSQMRCCEDGWRVRDCGDILCRGLFAARFDKKRRASARETTLMDCIKKQWPLLTTSNGCALFFSRSLTQASVKFVLVPTT